jgi:hypothetical protein
VRAFQDGLRAIRAFTVRKLDNPATQNSAFMANPLIIDDAESVTDKSGRGANAYEAARFSTGRGFMMYYSLTLNRDTALSIAMLSNQGNEMRLNLIPQPMERQVFDADGNPGNEIRNQWTVISAGNAKGNQDVCLRAQITVSNIQNAYNFAWDGNTPLFPYWGITIPNCMGNDVETPPDILITVQIFDLLGNLVASPDKNRCLGVVITGEAAFAIGNGRYAQSVSFDYDYLIKNKDASGGSPCGFLPAWNGLNNKGRLVAPGGYLVKMTVSSKCMEPQVSDIKLIMTNAKLK